jgi:methionine-rich copper-binding protein CopC
MGLPTLPEIGQVVRSLLAISRIMAVVVVTLLAQGWTAAPAHAHAVIIESSPTLDAVLPPGDAPVRLRFNSRIDHQRSRLTLTGPDGAPMAVAIAPDSAPDIVEAKMTGLTVGQYRLRWQVLAIDGHLTRGDIPFSVKAP